MSVIRDLYDNSIVAYKMATEQTVRLVAENFFSILKTECIYRAKPADFAHARSLIDEYIWFYNNERIQLETGEAPLARRFSA